MTRDPGLELRTEVAVVGAGPAGATAAYHLARAGIDVHLIDREMFPRDKVCGDLLGGDALVELSNLGIDPVEQWSGRATISRYLAVSCEGRQRHDDLNLGNGHGGTTYVIRRIDFDETLRRKAVDAGARWLSPYHCTHVGRENPGRFMVRGVTKRTAFAIRSEAVIYAAGARAGFRPSAARDDERILIAGRAYYADTDLHPGRSEFYYLDYLPLHYAWAFPVSAGIANAGVIMALGALKRGGVQLGLRLDRLIAETDEARRSLGNARRASPFQAALLRTGLQPGRLIDDGILFVGDCAGVANPFNGEGIGPAMVSGRLAARTLLAARRRGGFKLCDLGLYQDAVLARYGHVFSAAERMLGSRRSLCRLGAAGARS